jgi:predicted ferric reductase
MGKLEQLYQKQRNYLVDIADYFLRNYDEAIYDGSMRDLVDHLNGIEAQIEDAKKKGL